MATFRLGQKAVLDGEHEVMITGIIKYNQPFSAFNKKGTRYVVERQDGSTETAGELRLEPSPK